MYQHKMCEILSAKQKVAVPLEDGTTVNVLTLNNNLAQVWFEDSQGEQVYGYHVSNACKDEPIHVPLDGNYVINVWDDNYSIVRKSDKKILAEIHRRLPVIVTMNLAQ